MRSAKQRANDRRLGRMAKKRFSTKRKASSTRTKRSKPMARRRSSTRRRAVSRTVRRVASRRTGSKIISTVKPMASGIGGGILMETVASRVGMGQYNSLFGFGGAYLFGGVKGVLGKLGFDLISGRGISLGGLGGQQNTSMVGMQI